MPIVHVSEHVLEAQESSPARRPAAKVQPIDKPAHRRPYRSALQTATAVPPLQLSAAASDATASSALPPSIEARPCLHGRSAHLLRADAEGRVLAARVRPRPTTPQLQLRIRTRNGHSFTTADNRGRWRAMGGYSSARPDAKFGCSSGSAGDLAEQRKQACRRGAISSDLVRPCQTSLKTSAEGGLGKGGKRQQLASAKPVATSERAASRIGGLVEPMLAGQGLAWQRLRSVVSESER